MHKQVRATKGRRLNMFEILDMTSLLFPPAQLYFAYVAYLGLLTLGKIPVQCLTILAQPFFQHGRNIVEFQIVAPSTVNPPLIVST